MKKNDVMMDVRTILNEYRDLRKQSIKQVESIINTRNKYSYLTKEKIQQTIGSGVNPSRFGLQFDEELHEHGDKLKEIQDRMTFLANTLSSIVCSLTTEVGSSLPVDFSLVQEVQASVLQQTLLECTIGQRLASYDDMSLSAEGLVSLTSAFKFPPFLRPNQLDLIISS